MSSQEGTKKDRIASPLNFEWGDDGQLDDLDPFLVGNEGSLAGDDHTDISGEPKVIGLPTGDIPRPGSIAVDSRKRSTSSTISNQSDGFTAITRRKKKPKGMPKRPLSAYNLYFQSERARILSAAEVEGEKIGFEGLGKIIGKKWRGLDPEEVKLYEKLAEKDTNRYKKEMEVYNKTKSKKSEEDAKASATRVPSTTTAPLDTSAPRAYGATPGYQQAFPASSTSYPTSGVTSSLPPFTGTREELLRLHSLTNTSQVVVGARETVHHTFHQRPQENLPTSQPVTAVPYETSIPGAIVGTIPGTMMGGMPVGNLQRLPTGMPASQPNQPSMDQGYVADSFPMPPDMEIILSDKNGKDRKYRVQYSCYAMTREAAHKFIDGLMGPQSSEGQSEPPTPTTTGLPTAPAPNAAPSANGIPQPASMAMAPHQYGAPQFVHHQLPSHMPVSHVPMYPGTTWPTY